MTRDEWLKGYNAMPPAVQDYLLEPASGDREDQAQKELAYDNDAWDRVMDVVWELLFKRMNRLEFEASLKAVAGDRKTEDVERILLKYVVLPLGDLVTWDVETRLRELGVPSSEIQSAPRVSLRPVSYGAAVRRIASNAKVSILSEELVRRLREVLVSYIKGVRSDQQVLEILQRPQGEGGIGLERSQADRYMAAIRDFLLTTQVMSEEEYARWYQNYLREGSAPSAPEAEAEEPPAEGEAPPAPPRRRSSNEALESAIDRAMAEIGPLTKNGYLENRLRNTISTRLRDVRNALQVKDVLQRDEKVGGMSMAPEEAERVAGIVEKIYGETREQVAGAEKQKIQETVEEQKKKIEERKQRESEEHAKWYREKVQASKPEEAARQLLSAMANPPTAGAPRPVGMDGVVPPTRLVGLNEELGGMTVEAFRRLSKNPEQAAKQIYQKLETLKQESFEQWTEGVAAWRRSPLQQKYLTLVADSFREGKPVAELAESRRASDPSIPTAEELGAIIALNSWIQL